jgi:ankyrin repeat protein
LTGDGLHKAILLDRKSEVEKMLDTEDGPRLLEIPDKFGNLPLMIAVNRNNVEYIFKILIKIRLDYFIQWSSFNGFLTF